MLSPHATAVAGADEMAGEAEIHEAELDGAPLPTTGFRRMPAD